MDAQPISNSYVSCLTMHCSYVGNGVKYGKKLLTGIYWMAGTGHLDALYDCKCEIKQYTNKLKHQEIY